MFCLNSFLFNFFLLNSCFSFKFNTIQNVTELPELKPLKWDKHAFSFYLNSFMCGIVLDLLNIISIFIVEYYIFATCLMCQDVKIQMQIVNRVASKFYKNNVELNQNIMYIH